jgi:hypothetical protein
VHDALKSKIIANYFIIVLVSINTSTVNKRASTYENS